MRWRRRTSPRAEVIGVAIAESQATLDIRLMARAIELAWRGRYSTHPNPRVGCVIARDGAIIAEGWHQYAGEGHAEANALAQAGSEAAGATAYVTLEPCSHFGRTPPCADSLVQAGVARVVVAMTDPNPEVAGRGLQRLRDAGIEVTDGVLPGEAEKLNPGFLRRMRGGQPFVKVKVAASLDGRTAMASGESQWVTGAAARSDVQRLRARSGAIVTGIGTVLADDPSLTVRPEQMGPPDAATLPRQQPLRVVLDRQLRTPLTAGLLTTGNVWIICAPEFVDSEAAQHLRDGGVEVRSVPLAADALCIDAVLNMLAAADINEVLVEAGPALAGAFVSAGKVDEFWLYQAPLFLGSRGMPTVTLAIDRMADSKRWQVTDRRQIGEDQRLILTPR